MKDLMVYIHLHMHKVGEQMSQKFCETQTNLSLEQTSVLRNVLTITETSDLGPIQIKYIVHFQKWNLAFSIY